MLENKELLEEVTPIEEEQTLYKPREINISQRPVTGLPVTPAPVKPQTSAFIQMFGGLPPKLGEGITDNVLRNMSGIDSLKQSFGMQGLGYITGKPVISVSEEPSPVPRIRRPVAVRPKRFSRTPGISQVR